MSHHSAFIDEETLYCYGGLLGVHGSSTNTDIYKLDLNSQRWQRIPQDDSGCPARDDNGYVFDNQSHKLYVFGGYINGDKANDLWEFELNKNKWTCLHEGDYKLFFEKQDPNKIPAPRIGSKLLLLDSNTLLMHNGHDNENEKLADLWKFDLNTKQWSQIE